MNAVKFDDVGRTFTCEPGSSPATPGVLWWWVTVSGESHRYAAFRVEPTVGPTRVGRDSHYHPQTGTTMIARLRPAAAASHQATASPGPGEAPSSEPVEDDGRSEFPRRTPPRDQNQRRRAEKTTVRPLSDPHGLENDE